MRPFLAALALGSLLAACGPPQSDVVLYCAVDQEHAEPIVKAFEAATGLVVDAHYDVEATKSVGLRRRLEEEAPRPICDVFWNNEVVQTVLLARAGLLQPYVSPAAADLPAAFKDPGGLWTGFAARGRVLIVNTELRPERASWPTGLASFLAPESKDVCGMARPLTGTTAAHAGAWLAAWGVDGTFERFAQLVANQVHFGPGNAHLMRLVRDGELHFGFTDTDDVRAAVTGGFPVEQVVPDQEEGGFGLVVIPNTVSVVKGAPHLEAAHRLVDWLLGADVEARLAAGPSAQIPLRAGVPRPAHVLDLAACRLARVDWTAAALAWQEQSPRLEEFFVP